MVNLHILNIGWGEELIFHGPAAAAAAAAAKEKEIRRREEKQIYLSNSHTSYHPFQ